MPPSEEPAIRTNFCASVLMLGVLVSAQPAAVANAAPGAPWSGILDPSRAIDWSNAGITIPNYTANCPTQPSLVPNDPNAAAANTTAIQNALASCDASHNVVNIPAGTYYVSGIGPSGKNDVVIRGGGPN